MRRDHDVKRRKKRTCGRIASTGETREYNKNCEIADSRRKARISPGAFARSGEDKRGREKKQV